MLGLFMAGYFYISWVGIRQLRTHISIDKMALPDSYLQEFQHTFETALRNMQPISVFVLNPGDMKDLERLQSNFLRNNSLIISQELNLWCEISRRPRIATVLSRLSFGYSLTRNFWDSTVILMNSPMWRSLRSFDRPLISIWALLFTITSQHVKRIYRRASLNSFSWPTFMKLSSIMS